MHQRASRQARQHAVEQEVDIAARHQDVAGVDEQHVACHHPVERQRWRCLESRGYHRHAGQAGDVRAREGIDRQDLDGAGRRLGQHARRMAGSDLDDAARFALAHHDIRHCRIERREPRLVEQRSEFLQFAGSGVEQIDHPGKRRVVLLEQRFDGGIGWLRTGRRQQRGIAVRDEPAAGLQAEDRRQAEHQPAPASTQGQRLAHVRAPASALRGRRSRAAGRRARCRGAAPQPSSPRRP